jgi:hypothetical protein
LQNIYSVVFKLQQRENKIEVEVEQEKKPVRPKDSEGKDPRMRRTNSLTFSRKLKVQIVLTKHEAV